MDVAVFGYLLVGHSVDKFNAQTVVSGALGFFVSPSNWPLSFDDPSSFNDKVERGWIQIGDGEVRLDVLEEDPSSGWSVYPLPIPKSVVGVLSAGSVMMLEISPRIPTIRMGGYRSLHCEISRSQHPWQHRSGSCQE